MPDQHSHQSVLRLEGQDPRLRSESLDMTSSLLVSPHHLGQGIGLVYLYAKIGTGGESTNPGRLLPGALLGTKRGPSR